MVLLIDTSLTMSIRDFRQGDLEVERMTVLKDTLRRFVDGRPGDRFGVIVFGSEVATLTPPTFDRAHVAAQIQRIQVGMVGGDTALGDALGMALKQVRTPRLRPAVILVSDGADNNAGTLTPAESLAVAHQAGVAIHALQFGSDPYAAGRAAPPADGDGGAGRVRFDACHRHQPGSPCPRAPRTAGLAGPPAGRTRGTHRVCRRGARAGAAARRRLCRSGRRAGGEPHGRAGLSPVGANDGRALRGGERWRRRLGGPARPRHGRLARRSACAGVGRRVARAVCLVPGAGAGAVDGRFPAAPGGDDARAGALGRRCRAAARAGRRSRGLAGLATEKFCRRASLV